MTSPALIKLAYFKLDVKEGTGRHNSLLVCRPLFPHQDLRTLTKPTRHIREYIVDKTHRKPGESQKVLERKMDIGGGGRGDRSRDKMGGLGGRRGSGGEVLW